MWSLQVQSKIKPPGEREEHFLQNNLFFPLASAKLSLSSLDVSNNFISWSAEGLSYKSVQDHEGNREGECICFYPE